MRAPKCCGPQCSCITCIYGSFYILGLFYIVLLDPSLERPPNFTVLIELQIVNVFVVLKENDDELVQHACWG